MYSGRCYCCEDDQSILELFLPEDDEETLFQEPMLQQPEQPMLKQPEVPTLNPNPEGPKIKVIIKKRTLRGGIEKWQIKKD